jgi:uncharacterized protein YigE (DUF2233 family)
MNTIHEGRWARRWRRMRWSSVVALASLIGCAVPAPAQIAPEGDVPIAQDAAAWAEIAPGMSQRMLAPGARYPLTRFIALRIDPARYAFRAHYQPGAPLTLDEWRARLPEAIAIVNANFFDQGNRALGLVVADGVVYGESLRGRGGMLEVVDGAVRVRSLIAFPYAGEHLEQAVQAFPMLIAGGRAVYADPRPDRPSRRTVVGQDAAGHIVLLVTPGLTGLPLGELTTFLAQSDLGLVEALNLDGGGSSMLAIDVPGAPPVRARAFDPVPAVLAVYAR